MIEQVHNFILFSGIIINQSLKVKNQLQRKMNQKKRKKTIKEKLVTFFIPRSQLLMKRSFMLMYPYNMFLILITFTNGIIMLEFL